jgi:nucleolin
MQELEGRPLRLSLAEQNPPAGSPPSTVQAKQEETASNASDAEAEVTSASDLDGSTLQTTAAY